ncbi:MAG: arsenate reductase ArsC [Anaerolineales bacterium]|nr:arsenate reductase ArsC [Anaerolineales bacterium]
MKKIRVLFLCTGNSARSQMAEAFLRHYDNDRFEAHSAGLEPQIINPFTIQVMQEAGISMEGQFAKPLSDYLGKVHFGYLITVCSDADEKCPSVFPGLGQRLHWSYEDPAAFNGTDDEKMEKFRQVRDQIDRQIKKWLEEQPASG